MTLDYAKALCIVLMVVGHCCYINHFTLFIYTFHMPCFFFISGMLLSDICVENVKYGIIHKIRSYYLPFVKWSILFILLHNLFTYMGLQSGFYDVKTTMTKVLRVFLLKQSEPMLSQLWFLASLTISSLLAVFTTHFLKKKKQLNIKFLCLSIAISLSLSVILSYVEINGLVTMVRISFFANSFYLSGFLFRHQNLMKRFLSAGCMLLYIIGAICPLFIKLEFFGTRELSILLYYVVAMCGILATISLSRKLAEIRYFNVLSFIGRNTLYILVFHYLAFKLVSFGYVMMTGEDIELLAQNVIYAPEWWLWIVYSVVGVAIPLLISYFLCVAVLKSENNHNLFPNL